MKNDTRTNPYTVEALDRIAVEREAELAELRDLAAAALDVANDAPALAVEKAWQSPDELFAAVERVESTRSASDLDSDDYALTYFDSMKATRRLRGLDLVLADAAAQLLEHGANALRRGLVIATFVAARFEADPRIASRTEALALLTLDDARAGDGPDDGTAEAYERELHAEYGVGIPGSLPGVLGLLPWPHLATRPCLVRDFAWYVVRALDGDEAARAAVAGGVESLNLCVDALDPESDPHADGLDRWRRYMGAPVAGGEGAEEERLEQWARMLGLKIEHRDGSPGVVLPGIALLIDRTLPDRDEVIARLLREVGRERAPNAQVSSEPVVCAWRGRDVLLELLDLSDSPMVGAIYCLDLRESLATGGVDLAVSAEISKAAAHWPLSEIAAALVDALPAALRHLDDSPRVEPALRAVQDFVRQPPGVARIHRLRGRLETLNEAEGDDGSEGLELVSGIAFSLDAADPHGNFPGYSEEDVEERVRVLRVAATTLIRTVATAWSFMLDAPPWVRRCDEGDAAVQQVRDAMMSRLRRVADAAE